MVLLNIYTIQDDLLIKMEIEPEKISSSCHSLQSA